MNDDFRETLRKHWNDFIWRNEQLIIVLGLLGFATLAICGFAKFEEYVRRPQKPTLTTLAESDYHKNEALFAQPVKGLNGRVPYYDRIIADEDKDNHADVIADRLDNALWIVPGHVSQRYRTGPYTQTMTARIRELATKALHADQDLGFEIVKEVYERSK